MLRENTRFTLADRFNTGYDRGEISGTRRHRFLAAGLLPLPFGMGRTVGRNWNMLSDAFLGGWEVSTITMLQSGPYQTPTMAASFDRSNTNVGGRGVSARPDRIGDGNLPNHPNLYSPSVNIDDVNFGKLMFAQWAENSGNRTGQLGVRIDF